LEPDGALIAVDFVPSDKGWRLVISNRGSPHIVPPDIVRASSEEIIEEHAEHMLDHCRITLRGFRFDPKYAGEGRWVAEIVGAMETAQ
jgi:hypothetical protein